MATATDSSKKLDAPIMPAGAAMSCKSFHALAQRYAMKNMRKVCMISGMAIRRILRGFSTIILPWNEKMITRVSRRPATVTLANLGMNLRSR